MEWVGEEDGPYAHTHPCTHLLCVLRLQLVQLPAVPLRRPRDLGHELLLHGCDALLLLSGRALDVRLMLLPAFEGAHSKITQVLRCIIHTLARTRGSGLCDGAYHWPPSHSA